MAKTKTVKREAWGVFTKRGRLALLGDKTYYEPYVICQTEEDAEGMRVLGKTVRPVTISWEVDE